MSLTDRCQTASVCGHCGQVVGALPDPHQRPVMSVEEACEWLHIGRSLGYQLVRNGEFPAAVIRCGSRRVQVVTASLLAALGLESNSPPVESEGLLTSTSADAIDGGRDGP